MALGKCRNSILIHPIIDFRMKNRKLILVAVMLMLSIGNYFRIIGNENVRAVQFFSIAAIGALVAMLIQGVIEKVREKP